MTGTFIQQKSYHGASTKPSVPVKRSVYGAPIADQSQNTAPGGPKFSPIHGYREQVVLKQNTAPGGPIIPTVLRPGSKVSATHGPPIKRTILQNTAPGAPVPQIACITGYRAKVSTTHAATMKRSITVNPGEIHAQKKVRIHVPVHSSQPNIEHTPGIEKHSILNTASHTIPGESHSQKKLRLTVPLVGTESMENATNFENVPGIDNQSSKGS